LLPFDRRTTNGVDFHTFVQQGCPWMATAAIVKAITGTAVSEGAIMTSCIVMDHYSLLRCCDFRKVSNVGNRHRYLLTARSSIAAD
jgi:hypothetical protein